VSVPKCECVVRYHLQNAIAASVQHCPFHAAAAELYEIVDMLVSLTEQTERHRNCRCIHCRAVRALRKARGVAIAGCRPLGATEGKT
jgi:hypothetical protein